MTLILGKKRAIIVISDELWQYALLEVLPVMILLRKRDLIAAFFICSCVVLALCFTSIVRSDEEVFSRLEWSPFTVIIDAGHGGEDGGAVSASGVKESDLNLLIACRLEEIFHFLGQKTVMTRREDVSLGDQSLNTVRDRKSSDLQRRVVLANTTPGAVLISIHQNSLPSSPVTHGAQVFWNRQGGAEELAESIQEVLNQSVNSGHVKKAKPIPESIYLTRNAKVPSVIVECGFLSNTEETKLLQQPQYQLKLAGAITAGYLQSLKEEFE